MSMSFISAYQRSLLMYYFTIVSYMYCELIQILSTIFKSNVKINVRVVGFSNQLSDFRVAIQSGEISKLFPKMGFVMIVCVIWFHGPRLFFSTACSGYQESKHQSFVLLTLCDGNPPVSGFPHPALKGPVMWKAFLCHYVFMSQLCTIQTVNHDHFNCFRQLLHMENISSGKVSFVVSSQDCQHALQFMYCIIVRLSSYPPTTTFISHCWCNTSFLGNRSKLLINPLPVSTMAFNQ